MFISSHSIETSEKMIKRMKKILALNFAILLIGGCEIIFEEDLSSAMIHVIMPADGTVSDDKNQLFWWDPLDGVINYKLQIVEGDFTLPLSFQADTSIICNKLYIHLEPGSYEWRIKGMNQYSETGFSYGILVIRDTVLPK